MPPTQFPQQPHQPNGLTQVLNAVFSGTPKLMVWLLRLTVFLFMLFLLAVVVGSVVPFGLLMLRAAWRYYLGA